MCIRDRLRAMGRAQEIKEHFQRAGRDCDVAGEHEGADMRVVPVAIKMLVLVIAMMLMVMIMMRVRLRIGIGFGGEPFLHVWNLPVRIVETTAQYLLRGRPHPRCRQGRGDRGAAIGLWSLRSGPEDSRREEMARRRSLYRCADARAS